MTSSSRADRSTSMAEPIDADPTTATSGSGDDSTTDADLLTRHVAGDPYAFQVLYQRHRHRLWAVALRTCGNPQDAEDALQDALISALRNAGTFRGDSAVTTWLHRIVVNSCIDIFRRRTARRMDPLPEDAAVVVDPDDRIARSDLRVALLAALDQLPIDQRAAIVLVDIEGWPVIEAAAILGVPVGTIKSRCARGRAALATQLGSLRNPEPPENVRHPAVAPADDRGPLATPDHTNPSTPTEEVARHDQR